MSTDSGGGILIKTAAEKFEEQRYEERCREDRYRRLQRWFTAALTSATIVTTAIVAYQSFIMSRSLDQMSEQSKAARNSAQTAEQTLEEMKAGSRTAEALAIAAKRQADATNILALASRDQVAKLEAGVVETRALANASKDSAIAARASMELTRANFIADQRPYVLPRIDPRPVHGIVVGEIVSWKGHKINYGRSPAIDEHMQFFVFVNGRFAAATSRDWFKGLDANYREGIKSIIPSQIFEGFISYITLTSIEVVTESDHAYIMSHDYGVVLGGRIYYKDLFGNRYYTDWCRTRLQTGALAGCPWKPDESH